MVPGGEGALHHSAPSVMTAMALAPAHQPSAGARSWPILHCLDQDGGSGLDTAHFLGAAEAIRDTCSPQDLCSCSVLPDGLVQSQMDVT